MGMPAAKRLRSQRPSLADTLFSATQQRVLGRLFGEPGRSFYANELIAAAGGGSGAIQRELARLEAAGLVSTSSIGRQKHYQANRRAPIFEELRGLMLKTGAASALCAAETASPAYQVKPHRHVGVAQIMRRVGVTRRGLAAFCRKRGIKQFSFFGSVTRDDFKPDSDIDVKVDFEPGRALGLEIVDVKEQLSQLFGGRPVDLLTSPVISNPIRRRSIERDLTVAYASG